MSPTYPAHLTPVVNKQPVPPRRTMLERKCSIKLIPGAMSTSLVTNAWNIDAFRIVSSTDPLAGSDEELDDHVKVDYGAWATCISYITIN